MAQTQRLELRQGQSLVMTPQLQQSLKLLQYSSQELVAFIEQEMEKNPLLSLQDAPEETAEEQREETLRAEEAQQASEDTLELEAPDQTDLYKNSAREWEVNDGNIGEAEDFAPVSYRHNAAPDAEFSFEQTLSDKEKNLREHLLDQIHMDIHHPVERIIALQLLELVDDAGYLAADTLGISEMLHCDPKEVEAVLRKLQRFEPAGVFARTLAECLSLQLEERDRLDPAMQILIAHLDMLAEGKVDKLEKLCGVSNEDLREMIREIKTLNPKPGAIFEAEPVQPVVPDVYVRRKQDGSWYVELNQEVLPKVLVDKSYSTRVVKSSIKAEEKKFISDNLQSANWLVRTLNQRAETILKVASEIVRQQQGFFEKGIYHLKPLTLKDIAETCEVHESTVGRVTVNKYMATPKGTYELKYFFSSGVGGATEESDVSSKTVKHLIKQMIDGESAKTILSDDTLAEMLQKQGLNVARRTVAKYREALGIGSSVERRRAKKLSA